MFLFLYGRWTFKSSCALWHVCLIDSGVGKEMWLTIAVYQDVTTRVFDGMTRSFSTVSG